jgi:uncharacterized protein involved in exopolysaccharide biosynthesis
MLHAAKNEPVGLDHKSTMDAEVVTVQPGEQRGQRLPRFHDEISLSELADILWNGRLLILCAALVLGSGAALAAFLLPKRYEATVLISPVTKDARDSVLGEAASQFGELAALAGFSGAKSGAAAEAMATLQSEILTERYIQEHNLLPVLFAEKWDAGKHAWHSDHPPTLWQANRYFARKLREVTDDKKTGLEKLTITWSDPVLAAQWANGLVALTNDYLQHVAIEEADANVAYLKEQVEKSTTLEMKNTIYILMQRELRSAMMARGARQFALKTIDPAFPPEKPASPKPILWTVLGVVGGAILGATYLSLRSAWKARGSRGLR